MKTENQKKKKIPGEKMRLKEEAKFGCKTRKQRIEEETRAQGSHKIQKLSN